MEVVNPPLPEDFILSPLKIKEVGGKKAVDYFVDDNKISDQMVLCRYETGRYDSDFDVVLLILTLKVK